VTRRPTSNPVALVLAGGGARGAYEAGALSVLLPVLEERGERPRILLGTSAGALNVALLAADAHQPTSELIANALAIWESVTWSEIARRLVSGGSLLRLGEYAGEVLGLPGARLESLLDPEPLRGTLRERIDFEQLADNVQRGKLDAAGVVATSALTSRSVVFHSGLDSPPPQTTGAGLITSRLSSPRSMCWPQRRSRRSFPPSGSTDRRPLGAGTSTAERA
jgi:NTE family protein